MSKKAYSEQERERVKQDLLEVGLSILSQQGLKNTRLTDIIQAVGISKPFFYTFYPSLAELVICILDYQQEILFQLLQREMAREDLTLEEELWVYKRLNQGDFEAFQTGQEKFYGQLLSMFGIPMEACTPKELGNLFLSVVLIHNSAARSLPFFFSEELERTAQAQIKTHYRDFEALEEKPEECAGPVRGIFEAQESGKA